MPERNKLSPHEGHALAIKKRAGALTGFFLLKGAKLCWRPRPGCVLPWGAITPIVPLPLKKRLSRGLPWRLCVGLRPPLEESPHPRWEGGVRGCFGGWGGIEGLPSFGMRLVWLATKARTAIVSAWIAVGEGSSRKKEE